MKIKVLFSFRQILLHHLLQANEHNGPFLREQFWINYIRYNHKKDNIIFRKDVFNTV